MVFRICFFLFFSSSLYAQDPLNGLLDSLSYSSSERDKVRISMQIASQLAKDDWERALKYIDIAQRNAEESNSDNTIADFHIAEAEIYSNKGAWDIALENYLRAYDFYKDRPLKERYRLENDLAIAYAETENPSEALEFFHKIYCYEHTRNSPVNKASIANNIGLVWMREDLDSSMYYFNKSLHLVKNVELPYLKTFLYTNLGKTYALKDEFDTANDFFHLAIDQIDPKESIENIAWVYGEFSELFLRQEKIDSAIYYSKKAVKIYDSLGPIGIERLQALEVLYKSYTKNKEFEKATNNFEKFLAISDSLNLEEKKLNVQKLILEKEYRDRGKFRQLVESRNRSRAYSLTLGLFLVLLILTFFLYRYRQRLKRVELEKQLVTMRQKKLNAKLELKNKELIGKAMLELHRNKIIENALKELKATRLKVQKKETQTAIDHIANRLKRDCATNIWEEFELRFEQVHESFYTNLLKAHPDLTIKDKRLSALLKMNLTSKEIAQVTGQSLKTVENARTRLRKKLGITNSNTDLSSYLSSFG